MEEKIGIITLFNHKYKKIASASRYNFRRYAKKYNYDFIYYDHFIDESLSFEQNKMLVIQKEIEKYDWLFWINCDSIIMNINQKLEHFVNSKFDFIIQGEKKSINNSCFLHRCHNINNRCFFIRNTPLMKTFIEDILKCENILKNSKEEQQSNYYDDLVELTFSLNNEYKNKVLLLSPGNISSFWYNDDPSFLLDNSNEEWNKKEILYKPNDFIVNFQGHSLEKKEKIIIYISDKISYSPITSFFTYMQEYGRLHIDFMIKDKNIHGNYLLRVGDNSDIVFYESFIFLEPNGEYWIDVSGVPPKSDLSFSIYSENREQLINKEYFIFKENNSENMISITIPYRDRAEQLKACLISISKTKYDKIEIIIVADSDDLTLEPLKDFLKSYRFPVSIITFNTETCSPDLSVQINIASDICSGNIIFAVHAESVFIGDLFSDVAKRIGDNNCVVYSYGAFNTEHHSKLLIDFITNNQNMDGEEFYSKIREIAYPHLPLTPQFIFNPITWNFHPIYRPTYLEIFLGGDGCPLTKDNLNIINGYDERFYYGFGSMDQDFRRRLTRCGLIRVDVFGENSPYAIHLNHRNMPNRITQEQIDTNDNLLKILKKKGNIIGERELSTKIYSLKNIFKIERLNF